MVSLYCSRGRRHFFRWWRFCGSHFRLDGFSRHHFNRALLCRFGFFTCRSFSCRLGLIGRLGTFGGFFLRFCRTRQRFLGRFKATIGKFQNMSLVNQPVQISNQRRLFGSRFVGFGLGRLGRLRCSLAFSSRSGCFWSRGRHFNNGYELGRWCETFNQFAPVAPGVTVNEVNDAFDVFGNRCGFQIQKIAGAPR